MNLWWQKGQSKGCMIGSHYDMVKKTDKKKQQKKLISPYYNKPVSTCDTAVWVHGVLQCAKIAYHTHTHVTHFGNSKHRRFHHTHAESYYLQAHTCNHVFRVG